MSDTADNKTPDDKKVYDAQFVEPAPVPKTPKPAESQEDLFPVELTIGQKATLQTVSDATEFARQGMKLWQKGKFLLGLFSSK